MRRESEEGRPHLLWQSGCSWAEGDELAACQRRQPLQVRLAESITERERERVGRINVSWDVERMGRCAHPSRAAGRERAGLVPSAASRRVLTSQQSVQEHSADKLRSDLEPAFPRIARPAPVPIESTHTYASRKKERWTLCTKEDYKAHESIPGSETDSALPSRVASCSRIANARRRASCLGWRRRELFLKALHFEV